MRGLEGWCGDTDSYADSRSRIIVTAPHAFRFASLPLSSGPDGEPLSLGVSEEDAAEPSADAPAPTPSAGLKVSNAEANVPRRFELTILIPPGIPLAFCFYAKGQQLLSFRHRIISNGCVRVTYHATMFLSLFHFLFLL